jgi:hypothetical protein
MRWISFLEKLELLSVADFLDFGSGAFRSRIQAGTLTADRELTAPDATGTIALQTARSNSIQAQTAAGLLQLAAGADSVASIAPVGATGLASIAATNQAAGRAAIGSDHLSQSGRTQGGLSAIVSLDQPIQRFSGASKKYTIAYWSSGAAPTTTDEQWNSFADSFTEYYAGTTDLVFDTIPIGGGTHYYWLGRYVVGLRSSSNPSPTINFDIDTSANKSGTWLNLGSLSGFSAGGNDLKSFVSTASNFGASQIRIRIDVPVGATIQVYALQFYPSVADDFDICSYLLSANASAQQIRSDLQLFGTLRINTGATLNWQSPVITVTLTGAVTQTLTVAVPGATGIFVYAANARVTGEVTGTGANNVTIHNPALLTGAVSIILERYV